MSTELTPEDLKKWIDELNASDINSRTTFDLPIGHIGNGIYRISDGVYTGKDGWELFNKELMRQAGVPLNNTNK